MFGISFPSIKFYMKGTLKYYQALFYLHISIWGCFIH